MWCWSLSALITGYTDEAIFPYFYLFYFTKPLRLTPFSLKNVFDFCYWVFLSVLLGLFFFGGEECRNKKGINILKLMRASLFFFSWTRFPDVLDRILFLFSERHNWISVKLLVSLFFLKK